MDKREKWALGYCVWRYFHRAGQWEDGLLPAQRFTDFHHLLKDTDGVNRKPALGNKRAHKAISDK